MACIYIYVCVSVFLTFYSVILFGILFWHSFLEFYPASILTSYLSSFLASIRTLSLAFWHFFWHSIWHLFWHLFWHSFWHSFWDSICDILFRHSIWHLFRHSLWHGHWRTRTAHWDCSWGPAVPTEICSSRLRSGRAHWDLELVVEVRQCPLRSGARGWGPAVPDEKKEKEKEEEEEGGKEKASLIIFRDPHLAGGEHTSPKWESCLKNSFSSNLYDYV